MYADTRIEPERTEVLARAEFTSEAGQVNREQHRNTAGRNVMLFIMSVLYQCVIGRVHCHRSNVFENTQSVCRVHGFSE